MSANAAARRRRFGNVRQLKSGHWQARYTGPDGLTRTAPNSFQTKRGAEQWLVETEAEMLRGQWLDPSAGAISVRDYARRWVAERRLKPRTREEYERHLRLHIGPYLGTIAVKDVTPQHIRTWRASIQADGIGHSTVAKTYRILHAIFATAADDDEIIRRNPCRVKGAGQDKAHEPQPRPWNKSSRSPNIFNLGIGY